MEEKRKIRDRVLEQRNALPKREREEKSRVICRKVCGMPEYLQAEYLLLYRSFRSEVETKELMEDAWRKGKKVYLPRVKGKELEFCKVRVWDDLEKGIFGIEEPKKQCEVLDPNIKEKDMLMIMPGVAFDRRRRRIGYGGGYYDRYLKMRPDLKTVAVCFECQIQEEIPEEEHDICPVVIITEKNILKKGENKNE